MTPIFILENYLKDKCRKAGLDRVAEHQFSTKRRFRWDYCIPSVKMAFEYNGGIYMLKSGHSNLKGLVRDCDKLNLGQKEGWKVYQFTADHLNGNLNKTLDFIDSIFKDISRKPK
jgi:very-short-patch-repair endonuclease